MSEQKKIQELEKAIIRFYDGYAWKRIVLSSAIVAFFGSASSFCAYTLLESSLAAVIIFLVVGFVGINFAFLVVVPRASELAEQRDLLCGAIRKPSRIVSHSTEKIELLDQSGNVQCLKVRELKLWKAHVIPFLIEQQVSGRASRRRLGERRLTASERKYLSQRRQEVLESEAKLKEERERLKKDRSELKIREADLESAEEVVIQRLSVVERAEAELEQLRIVVAEEADQSVSEYDRESAKKRESELQAKEADLNAMKAQLAKDRQTVDQQKVDLETHKATVTRVPLANQAAATGPEESLAAREAALKAQQEKIEAEAAELEERANYLTASENSLIERLDELTHREASLEQNEINAGIRED